MQVLERSHWTNRGVGIKYRSTSDLDMIDDGTMVELLRRLRSWDVQVYRGRRGSLHIHSELGSVSVVPEAVGIEEEKVVIEGEAEGYTPVTLTFKPSGENSNTAWSEECFLS